MQHFTFKPLFHVVANCLLPDSGKNNKQQRSKPKQEKEKGRYFLDYRFQILKQ
jgi:hypothetical protein